MPSNLVPIEELLPQQGAMRLLDRVESWQPERIVASACCEPSAWYADEHGAMPSWIGIELMAQAIAAHVNLVSRHPGTPIRRGVLIGTRSYRADASRLSSGTRLTVRADVVFRDESGLGAYDCAIERGADTIAEATIKVFEPDDFEQFVHAGSA
jgi:predicted hotdog family 3-hydroxylacyl-ACP dehydratase